MKYFRYGLHNKKHASNKCDYFISNTDKDGISSINKQSKTNILLKDVCNRKNNP